MYWFDTILLLLLAVSALLGAWAGLVGQVARIVCVGFACYSSILLHEPMAALLEEHLLKDAHPIVIDVLAYVSVFMTGYLILYYATRLIRDSVHEADLVGYDRLLGAVLGAAKMAVVLGVACLGMTNYRHPATEPILEKSKLASLFADGMERIVIMVPEEFKAQLKEAIFQVRDQVLGKQDA